MGLKSDSWIREKSLKERMIEPFCEDQVGRDVVSYGVSSYGYDIRVGREFKIFTNVNSTVVDPKEFDDKNVIDFEGDIVVDPVVEKKVVTDKIDPEDFFYLPTSHIKGNMVVTALEPKSELGLVTYPQFGHYLKSGEYFRVLCVEKE